MGFVKAANKNDTESVGIIGVKVRGKAGEHQRAKVIKCLIVVIASIPNLAITKLSFKLILEKK
jgi:hypothetical protein